MNIWIDEGFRLLTIALGNPGDPLKYLILITIGMVAFIGVMNRAGYYLGINYPDRGALFILLASVLAALLLNTFLHLHVLGKSPQVPAVVMLTVFTGMGVVLAVGAPLACLFQKANYFKAIFSVMISAAGMMLIVLLIAALLNAIWKSDLKFKGIERPSDGISNFFLQE